MNINLTYDFRVPGKVNLLKKRPDILTNSNFRFKRAPVN
jgi:hypothetical protein